VKDPNRVFKVLAREQHSPRLAGLSLAEFREFARAQSLAQVIAASDGRVRLGFETQNQATYALFVSANYFDALGVSMQLGRGFRADEDVLDAPENVAVLSYATWRDHYGSNASILGGKIEIDDVPFIVIGVAPETFTGTSSGREDLWLPLAAMQSLRPNDAATVSSCARPTIAARISRPALPPASLANRPRPS
jgi:hypothetical protein